MCQGLFSMQKATVHHEVITHEYECMNQLRNQLHEEKTTADLETQKH